MLPNDPRTLVPDAGDPLHREVSFTSSAPHRSSRPHTIRTTEKCHAVASAQPRLNSKRRQAQRSAVAPIFRAASTDALALFAPSSTTPKTLSFLHERGRKRRAVTAGSAGVKRTSRQAKSTSYLSLLRVVPRACLRAEFWRKP
ncbi:hypothetical protein MRX96_004992 [Rhipicephalus microplus]